MLPHCWKCGRQHDLERTIEWVGGRGYVTLWQCRDYRECAFRADVA